MEANLSFNLSQLPSKDMATHWEARCHENGEMFNGEMFNSEMFNSEMFNGKIFNSEMLKYSIIVDGNI